jgi:hypothetical protein
MLGRYAFTLPDTVARGELRPLRAPRSPVTMTAESNFRFRCYRTPNSLVHFNDRRCGTIAELRSVILKARRLAHDDAERERAAAAVKAWLLARSRKTSRDGGGYRGNGTERAICRRTPRRLATALPTKTKEPDHPVARSGDRET